MNHNIIAGAVLITVVFLTGCGDQQQSNADPQTAKPIVTEQTPLQEQFNNVTVRLDTPAFGGVDGINDIISPKPGSTIIIKGETIRIAGNYVDAVNRTAAAGVVALVDGKPYVATYGGERPDIAKAHNNPKYLNSQFYVEIPVAEIGTGLHDLKMRVIASDKSGYYESDLIARLDVK